MIALSSIEYLVITVDLQAKLTAASVAMSTLGKYLRTNALVVLFSPSMVRRIGLPTTVVDR